MDSMLCIYHLFTWSVLIFLHYLKLFISALADGLSLEFEWQQVSSSLQESFQYSSRSHKCSNLDYLHWSTYFQHIIINFILKVFHISVSGWSFTGARVTASFLKSHGLFSVFWPITIMQGSGWSSFVLWLLSPPITVSILWWLYQEHLLPLA